MLRGRQPDRDVSLSSPHLLTSSPSLSQSNFLFPIYRLFLLPSLGISFKRKFCYSRLSVSLVLRLTEKCSKNLAVFIQIHDCKLLQEINIRRPEFVECCQ